jgi:methyltransferase (TIGR00027 family)
MASLSKCGYRKTNLQKHEIGWPTANGDTMNPISNTAFYTCAIRAADAANLNPIGDDSYAHLFMNDIGNAIAAQIKAPPKSTVSVVVRHRIIDDLLRGQLAVHPDTVIIILGCGFDTRAFRIPGGHWYEIDEPQVIEFKNAQLPASPWRNPLQRISINFSEGHLEDYLPKVTGSAPVVVVMEGIFYYLNEQQIDATLSALRNAYPAHTLICDLMNRVVANKYAKEARQDIENLGSRWLFIPDDPVAVIKRYGYRTRVTVSTAKKILEFEKRSHLIYILLRLLAPALVTGFGVHVFDLVPAKMNTQR